MGGSLPTCSCAWICGFRGRGQQALGGCRGCSTSFCGSKPTLAKPTFFPPPFRSFCLSLWEPPRGLLVVFEAPALQTPPKFHEKTPREGRKERILRREREKRAKFWAVQGKGVQGKGGPGKGGSGGTEHDQTKTLKPPHGNRETNTHATHTHKHTQTHTNIGQSRSDNDGQSRFGQSRFRPCEASGRSNVHVWSSRAVVCEPRRPSKPP